MRIRELRPRSAPERWYAPSATVIETLVSESIADSCRRWPDRPALSHKGTTLTYAELGARIKALAAAYRSIGIAAGDRVVCQLPRSSEHVVAMAAAWAVGVVHVGAHPDLTGTELADVVTRTGASLLFQARPTDDDPQATLRAVRTARPAMRIVVQEDPDGADTQLAALLQPHRIETGLGSIQPTTGAQPAALLRTSGTTGTPKYVVETLPALWAKVSFFANAVHAGTDDVHLLYLPVSHVFGMKLALMALATGGHLVLAERFTAEKALQLIEEKRVTVLPGTPTHFTLLVRALDPARHHVDGLRWAVSAAAPLPRPLADDMYARLGVEIFHVYGCSEGFLTATTDRSDISLGSAGRRVFRGPPGSPPDGSVTVLELERDVPMATNEIGEIAYGAAVPVRYWEEPAVATNGWYRTGDIGCIDSEGRVFVQGRLKELVNRGGLKVSCGEIEIALRALSSISDCAVIASPDPILGEAICACVVAFGGNAPTLDDLRSQLSSVLARHKLPDELYLLERIPRTPLGKIDRAALTALVVDGELPRARLRPRVDTPGASR